MATKKTDPVSEEVMLDQPTEAQDIPEGMVPQTDSEPPSDEALPAEGEALESEISHTGTEPALESASEGDSPQTEMKSPRTARRRKKTDEIQSQSDTEADPGTNSGSDGVEPGMRARRTRTRTRPTSAVLAIDEHLSVETDADKARNDLLDLLESQKTGRILSGTIQGIERPEPTGEARAVLYHGDFKVLIPATQAVEPPDDFRGRLPEDVLHYMLTKRLGAEIDYIVKGIDPKAGVAVGSRLEAMTQKRRQYYFGTDRDGNNLLYSGVCAEARVVSVIRAGIFVDLFGIEVYIPLRELSYQRMMDAAGYFQPGQRILVKILEVDRSNRNQIRVSASVKQAGENPYERALRKYSVGNRYVGTVSMVDTNGVFVALDGGIDCLCSYPKRGRPPRGARVTVRILGINNETNRIWGAITHIAAAR